MALDFVFMTIVVERRLPAYTEVAPSKRRFGRLYFSIVLWVEQVCGYARPSPAGPIRTRVVKPDDTPFISQFETYPSSDHDDELDCASIALSALINPYAAGGEDSELANVEPLKLIRGAP
jgi:hypothetical protein